MIVGCPSSVMHCVSSTIASKDISQTSGWILTKRGSNDPYMALFNNCSNGSGLLLSRSHKLKIDF